MPIAPGEDERGTARGPRRDGLAVDEVPPIREVAVPLFDDDDPVAVPRRTAVVRPPDDEDEGGGAARLSPADLVVPDEPDEPDELDPDEPADPDEPLDELPEPLPRPLAWASARLGSASAAPTTSDRKS